MKDDFAMGVPWLCAGLLLVSCAAARAQPIPGPQDQPPNDRFNPGSLSSTLVVPETHVERFRHPVIDTHSQVYYDGNSQGGIMGGAVAAVMIDGSRATLGVPGMNYSTLLQRSVDFDQYAAFLYASYRSSLDQQFVLSFIQGLWDRAENDGYAQHLTSDPYPGIPAKDLLLIEAFGDHQVANVSTEVLARTKRP